MKADDKVTCVRRRGVVHAIFRGSVAWSGDSIFQTYQLSMPSYFFFQEGITWIRGHHEDDSAEVQAMLAAYHLSRA